MRKQVRRKGIKRRYIGMTKNRIEDCWDEAKRANKIDMSERDRIKNKKGSVK